MAAVVGPLTLTSNWAAPTANGGPASVGGPTGDGSASCGVLPTGGMVWLGLTVLPDRGAETGAIGTTGEAG